MRRVSPRHVKRREFLGRTRNFSKQWTTWKIPKIFQIPLSSSENFKRHLRFVDPSPSLSPSGATTSLASKTWKRMSFERRASKTSKRGYSDENHGTRVSSPPSSPFFHTVSGTQETGQVSVHSFFSPFYTLSTGSSESFSFSSQRIFLPGNIRQTLVGETRMTNGGGGGGRERPLLQPVAHFGRWNGSSFEEVEKKMAEIIYIYVRFVKRKKRKCLV